MNIDPVAGPLLFSEVGKRHRHGTDSTIVNRLPILRFLPRGFRAHFVAMCGEFAGTFLFLFFAYSGTQVANTQTQAATSKTTLSQATNPAQLLYISLCFGFSLAVNAWVFFRISGGLFNPAVTLGLCLVGGQSWIRGVLVTISQLLGAIASAAVVSALFPGPLNVKTAISAGTSVSQGLFIEIFLTAQLIFTIFMLAAEKHKATFIAPIGIGLSLFIAELTGVYYTGGSLNPARSFAPNVVLHSFDHDHWIYWLGPILGSILASGFYKFIKMLEYETANPGQDFNEEEQANFDPNAHKSIPTIDYRPNEDEEQEKHGEPETLSSHTEATDYYDPDGVTPSPDSRVSRIGAHSAIKGKMKGPRTAAGHSPARSALKPEAVDSTNTYTAGPSAESGHRSQA